MRAVGFNPKRNEMVKNWTVAEIKWLVEGYVAGTVPVLSDVCFAMAVYFKGMTIS